MTPGRGLLHPIADILDAIGEGAAAVAIMTVHAVATVTADAVGSPSRPNSSAPPATRRSPPRPRGATARGSRADDPRQETR